MPTPAAEHPFLARLDRLVYQKGRYAIWTGTLLHGPAPPGERVSLMGYDLAPGPEGFLRGEGRLEHHPTWGERLRVSRSEPLSLEDLLAAEGFLPSLEEALVLLQEVGHTALPLAFLGQYLNLSPEELLALAEPSLRAGHLAFRGRRIGLAARLREEEAILEAVRRMAQPGPLLRPPREHGLSPEQARIFEIFRRGRLAILAGGPGTGKSHTVSRLLASPSLNPEEVALAAPTGKAAKRLAQLAGRPAHTVHRLLGVRPDGTFHHGPSRPLPFRLVVVDEASMLDVPTALALFLAVGPGTLLLLVGDPNQLPPVGPGQPFADLLDRVPTLRLTALFRQARGNPLVENARRLLEGEEPMADPEDPRFLLLLVEEEEILPTLLAWSSRVDVVLTATNQRGPGVVLLNTRIKEARNPSFLTRVGFGLPIGSGDPAVFTRNEYAIGLMNGETGTVLGLSAAGELLFDNGQEVFPIPPEHFPKLLPAYAMSVHRSQGSEWPRVLVALSAAQGRLLSRELVYTALTRAKEQAVLVASRKSLDEARRHRAARRFTWLQILT